MNPQAVSRRRQKEGIMLNISLGSQGFPGLSRATSLWHHPVQLPKGCRASRMKTPQPISLEARRVLREGKRKQDESTSRVRRGEFVLFQLKASTSRETAATASPEGHSPLHFPPTTKLSCVHSIRS